VNAPESTTTIDEPAEREAFERIIRNAPYEHSCKRFGPNSDLWPGVYRQYETHLAWDIWLTRARIAAQREAELVKALRECLSVMECQEKRETGEFHISGEVFMGMWSDAKALARAALAPESGK
jgi:hypothetical protein